MRDWHIIEIVIAIVVGLVLLFVFLGLFNLFRAARDVKSGRNVEKIRKLMKDPVSGTLTVTGISNPDPEYSWQTANLSGVVSAPGLEPCAVRRSGLVSTAMWPKAGQVLPVLVDRARPDFFIVEWVKVKPEAEAGWEEAQRLAAAMRSGAEEPAA